MCLGLPPPRPQIRFFHVDSLCLVELNYIYEISNGTSRVGISTRDITNRWCEIWKWSVCDRWMVTGGKGPFWLLLDFHLIQFFLLFRAGTGGEPDSILASHLDPKDLSIPGYRYWNATRTGNQCSGYSSVKIKHCICVCVFVFLPKLSRSVGFRPGVSKSTKKKSTLGSLRLYYLSAQIVELLYRIN